MIRIGREILCLPYAGFLLNVWVKASQKPVFNQNCPCYSIWFASLILKGLSERYCQQALVNVLWGSISCAVIFTWSAVRQQWTKVNWIVWMNPIMAFVISLETIFVSRTIHRTWSPYYIYPTRAKPGAALQTQTWFIEWVSESIIIFLNTTAQHKRPKLGQNERKHTMFYVIRTNLADFVYWLISITEGEM